MGRHHHHRDRDDEDEDRHGPIGFVLAGIMGLLSGNATPPVEQQAPQGGQAGQKGETPHPETIEQGDYGVEEKVAHYSPTPTYGEEQMEKEESANPAHVKQEQVHNEETQTQSNPYQGQKISHLIVMAALPILFFNFFTIEGRHAYCDLLTEPPLGNLLSWLPFILVMAIGSAASVLALWLAFGFNTIIIVANMYHHTYKPIYPFIHWLNGATWLAYLGMGIWMSIQAFNFSLIPPITITSMTLAVLISIVVCSPFTLQMSRLSVSEEVAKRKGFLYVNLFLSFYWLILFVIMAASSWIAHAVGFASGSAGSIILGTVIPILVPIFGLKTTKPLATWFIAKYGHQQALPEKEAE